MDADKTTIERAFDLARSGACSRVGDIVARLGREGYDGRQIHGPVLKKQLACLIEQARKADDGRRASQRMNHKKARDRRAAGKVIGTSLQEATPVK